MEELPREDIWRYLNDAEFHARVNIGAQAVMAHWEASYATREGFMAHFDDLWAKARVLAFKVVQALEAAEVPS